MIQGIKETLEAVLQSRVQYASLSEQYDLQLSAHKDTATGAWCVPPETVVPDDVIIGLLERELVLLDARLYLMDIKQYSAGKQLRKLDRRIKQVCWVLSRMYPKVAAWGLVVCRQMSVWVKVAADSLSQHSNCTCNNEASSNDTASRYAKP